jgi:hypothetical protein
MIPFKEVAMLTSGLLARKGAAIPASLGLAPFHHIAPSAGPAQPAAPPQPAPTASLRATAPAPAPTSPRIESWPPLPFPGLRAAPRPTSDAQPSEAETKDVPPAAVADARAAEALDALPADGKLAKVSLRLDPARHLKLRLAAAHQRRSGQQILLAALDAYVEAIVPAVMDGDCACLKRSSGA